MCSFLSGPQCFLQQCVCAGGRQQESWPYSAGRKQASSKWWHQPHTICGLLLSCIFLMESKGCKKLLSPLLCKLHPESTPPPRFARNEPPHLRGAQLCGNFGLQLKDQATYHTTANIPVSVFLLTTDFTAVKSEGMHLSWVSAIFWCYITV